MIIRILSALALAAALIACTDDKVAAAPPKAPALVRAPPPPPVPVVPVAVAVDALPPPPPPPAPAAPAKAPEKAPEKGGGW